MRRERERRRRRKREMKRRKKRREVRRKRRRKREVRRKEAKRRKKRREVKRRRKKRREVKRKRKKSPRHLVVIFQCSYAIEKRQLPAKSVDEKRPKKEEATSEIKKIGKYISYKDVTIGNGKSPRKGCKCTVKYVGTLPNKHVFDQSGKKGFTFKIGVGEVIKGWDDGIMSMRLKL